MTESRATDSFRQGRRRLWLSAGCVVICALVYVCLYQLAMLRHKADTTLASAQLAEFNTILTSGNPDSYRLAWKRFGPIQSQWAVRRPEVFEPWTWWTKEQPLARTMRDWAVNSLAACTVKTCGLPGRQDCSGPMCRAYRIDLREANLQNASLRGADLSDTLLAGVNLVCADLSQANLTHSIMVGADLSGTNFEGSNLTEANIADAITNDYTNIPEAYHKAGLHADSYFLGGLNTRFRPKNPIGPC